MAEKNRQQVDDVEHIVHGSKNQNDSKKLTFFGAEFETNVRHFDLLLHSTGLDHPQEAGRNVAHSFQTPLQSKLIVMLSTG